MLILFQFVTMTAHPAERSADLGGNLASYMSHVDALNREGRAIRIAGVCASACTIYLGVKNACVDLSAELWFHAAYRPRDRQLDPAGSLRMLAYYPPPVRRWAIESGALEQTTWSVRHMLTGSELIGMGMRACRGSNSRPQKKPSR